MTIRSRLGLFFGAALLATGVHASSYSCKFTVLLADGPIVKHFPYNDASGAKAVPLEGIQASVYSDETGKFHLRLGTIPTLGSAPGTDSYSYAVGYDFPRRVDAHLTAKGAPPSILSCEKR